MNNEAAQLNRAFAAHIIGDDESTSGESSNSFVKDDSKAENRSDSNENVSKDKEEVVAISKEDEKKSSRDL